MHPDFNVKAINTRNAETEEDNNAGHERSNSPIEL